MGKNKNSKGKNMAKTAVKNKSKVAPKKVAAGKVKLETKKTPVAQKGAAKNKATAASKSSKKFSSPKIDHPGKKNKIDKNLKNKNQKIEKKPAPIVIAQKSKTLTKEQLPAALVTKKNIVASKKNAHEEVKNTKGLNGKKKNEKDEIKAKGAKGNKGDKEKSDSDFDEAFDDFEMIGDEIIDDSDFDADLLLEEEAKKNAKKTKKILDDEIREQLAEEIINLSEEYGLIDVLKAIKSLEFFSSDSIDCTEKACDNPATTHGHCRYHYIKRWKDIKKKELILQEGKLQTLIEDLISKHPFKYIEAILNDLMDDKTFSGVLRELNIDMTSEEGFDDVSDDEMEEEDIAFETKVTAKVAFDED